MPSLTKPCQKCGELTEDEVAADESPTLWVCWECAPSFTADLLEVRCKALTDEVARLQARLAKVEQVNAVARKIAETVFVGSGKPLFPEVVEAFADLDKE